MLNLDAIARERCAKLFTAKAAQQLPKDVREALIIIAFTYGAAWALNEPDMIALGDAQIDAFRSTQQ